MATTIRALLNRGAAEAPAIGGEGKPELTHGALRDFADETGAGLNRLGLGRGDRIAIVLANGPEMATAFLAVAGAATAAPLNPAYRAEEFDFYLSDLKAGALIVQAGVDSPAIAVARKRQIPVLALTPRADAAAGLFDLQMTGAAADASAAHTASLAAERRGPAAAADTALILHTSGTTSRPKIVPLTQSNLAASAANIGKSLALTPADRCLNIMPLFHIHGLIAAVLSSLAAGGATWCSPGFNALRFFSWLPVARPSWYTAAPTMHQAILARAARNEAGIAKHPLRLIRSSSSSLPSQVMSGLETRFGCPVIESYGMTEAAHQMAANPLPPARRKPGSVGVAAGPEIAVLDAAGGVLAAGEIGEVAIRGANVTAGYENNPEANAENFTQGWFRTGDQGVLDAEGYLSLTGRLKEIINRGGEKIAPREVDEVLMEHPAVAQVVTFAMPHKSLGEDVAAAVVLREDAEADAADIRAFAALRLADFKVPRRVLVLDEIPKGATGKLQRVGLAAKLGLT